MAGQAEFPYVPTPESLKRLLEKVPSIGTPEKADQTWLTGLGFGGGNNRMSLALLKQVGILDSASKPTDLYKALRAKNRAAFGTGIRKAYSSLFAMYPDAHRQDDEALMAFARSRTNYAATTQRLAVRTFKVFAGFGDFDDSGGSGGDDDDQPTERDNEKTKQRRPKPEGAQGTVALTVNIQLQLPPSADGEVYDKLFAAMAKHLKGLISLG